MTTSFTNSGLWEGQAGDPAIKNSWGPPLVTNFTLLESMINGTSTINVAGQTAVTLTVANGAPDQRRELVQIYTGAIGANCVVSLPNVPKYGWAQNNTTGGFNIILTAGVGITATIPPDGHMYLYSCDGATNVVLPSLGFGGAINALGGIVVGGNTILDGSLLVLGTSTLTGVTNGGDAAAGQIGEYVSASAAGIQLSNVATRSVAPITLSAGDWEVSGNAFFEPNAGVTSFGFVSAALTGGTISSPNATFQLNLPSIPAAQGSIGPIRHSSNLSATITVNLTAGFAGAGIVTANAFIQARRMR